jgi:hypothetical protein
MGKLLSELISEAAQHLRLQVEDEPGGWITVTVTNPKIENGGLIFRDITVVQADKDGSGSSSTRIGESLSPGASSERRIKRPFRSQSVRVEAWIDGLAIGPVQTTK